MIKHVCMLAMLARTLHFGRQMRSSKAPISPSASQDHPVLLR